MPHLHQSKPPPTAHPKIEKTKPAGLGIRLLRATLGLVIKIYQIVG